ncbi:MAG TPA: ferredoxin [Streptosporangiaceae bacterium]
MSRRLHIDPIACAGHGLCADLLPEAVELDEWGYPMLRTDAIGPGLLRYARRAVNACPTLALRLVRTADQPQLTGPGRRVTAEREGRRRGSP